MGDGRIDDQGPKGHEDAQGGELHAVSKRAANQCRGDDREGHLEHHVDSLGDRLHGFRRAARTQGKRNVRTLGDVGTDTVQHEAREVADVCIAVREGDAVAGDRPDDRYDAADRERLHQRRQNVLLADHAGVEKCQAGNGHQQHESGAGQHPGGIAAVNLRFGRRRHRSEQCRQQNRCPPPQSKSLHSPVSLCLLFTALRNQLRRCGSAGRVQCP